MYISSVGHECVGEWMIRLKRTGIQAFPPITFSLHDKSHETNLKVMAHQMIQPDPADRIDMSDACQSIARINSEYKQNKHCSLYMQCVLLLCPLFVDGSSSTYYTVHCILIDCYYFFSISLFLDSSLSLSLSLSFSFSLSVHRHIVIFLSYLSLFTYHVRSFKRKIRHSCQLAVLLL